MSDRALPSGDGPVACPFVAFVDDRDERGSSPDHRHRCYAETSPAPRALAHQEAYCLSSAFSVCPTFQDWARREAARVQAGGARSGAGQPIPGLAEERPSAAIGDGDDEAFEPVYEDRPRRSNQRDWASPPPWLSRTEPGDPAGASDLDEAGGPGSSAGAAAAAAAAAGAGGLSGSFADRLASPPDGARQRTPVWRTGDAWDDEIGAPGDDEPHAGRADAAAEAGAAGLAAAAQSIGADDGPPRRQRERGQGGASERGDHRPGERDRADRGAGHDAERRREVAPSWERPARLETYPSLRSRRLPDFKVSSLLLGTIAVVLAAILLFFLPGLLGIGSQPAGGSPTPTSSLGTQTPAESLQPTFAAEPSQTVYLVQAGDTMSKIAKKFGVPLAALVDANKTNIPNPNVLNIGDQVFIPSTTPTSLPGASPSP